MEKDRLKQFLLSHYKPSRLKNRDSGFWSGYIDLITESKYKDLISNGYFIISHHESISNQTLIVDKDLNVCFDKIEHPVQDIRLTHLF